MMLHADVAARPELIISQCLEKHFELLVHSNYYAILVSICCLIDDIVVSDLPTAYQHLPTQRKT